MIPVHVAITSFKGGVGCSTLTVLLASRLYYEHSKHVAIIDCDQLNPFCSSLRASEVKDSNGYPVLEAADKTALELAENLPENTEVVFYDIPKSGAFSLMWKMDIVYFPIEEKMISTECVRRFFEMVNEAKNKGVKTRFRAIMTKCNLKSNSKLWNLVTSAGVDFDVQVLITDIKLPNIKYYSLKSHDGRPCVSTVSAMDYELVKKIKINTLENDLLKISKLLINHKNKII